MREYSFVLLLRLRLCLQRQDTPDTALDVHDYVVATVDTVSRRSASTVPTIQASRACGQAAEVDDRAGPDADLHCACAGAIE